MIGRWAALACLALLAGGCARAPLPTSLAAARPATALEAARRKDPQPAVKPVRSEEASAELVEHLEMAFQANFSALDANGDAQWTAADFSIAPADFRRLLGGFDANRDGAIAFDEYYGPTRAAALRSEVESRALVSANGVGGRVTLDKALFMFDVYLQDRIVSTEERLGAIAEAFAAADQDQSNYLRAAELELALATLEARADLADLRRRLAKLRKT